MSLICLIFHIESTRKFPRNTLVLENVIRLPMLVTSTSVSSAQSVIISGTNSIYASEQQ